MVRITFPAVLARHVECPPMDVEGTTVRDALESAFVARPKLRGYVLDDAGALRGHMALFVDGAVVRDRSGLTDRLRDGAEIHVLQALSGG